MEQEAAVRSRVVRIPAVLSHCDIVDLDGLYAAIRCEEQASHDAAAADEASAGAAASVAGGAEEAAAGELKLFQHPNLTGPRDSPHTTGFLHCGGRMARDLPELLAKSLGVMRAGDIWGLLGSDDEVRYLLFRRRHVNVMVILTPSQVHLISGSPYKYRGRRENDFNVYG
jgi:hypothetical protein